MATTWTYGDWRGQSGSTAQRARLVLHVQEVEERLAGFRDQRAGVQSVQRYELESYLKYLLAKLDAYDEALGLGLGANDPVFVGIKPRYDTDRG